MNTAVSEQLPNLWYFLHVVTPHLPSPPQFFLIMHQEPVSLLWHFLATWSCCCCCFRCCLLARGRVSGNPCWPFPAGAAGQAAAITPHTVQNLPTAHNAHWKDQTAHIAWLHCNDLCLTLHAAQISLQAAQCILRSAQGSGMANGLRQAQGTQITRSWRTQDTRV